MRGQREGDKVNSSSLVSDAKNSEEYMGEFKNKYCINNNRSIEIEKNGIEFVYNGKRCFGREAIEKAKTISQEGFIKARNKIKIKQNKIKTKNQLMGNELEEWKDGLLITRTLFFLFPFFLKKSSMVKRNHQEIPLLDSNEMVRDNVKERGKKKKWSCKKKELRDNKR